MRFFPPKITSAERLLNTLQRGELVFDTDLNSLYYGDGSTLGGLEVGSSSSTVVTPYITLAIQNNTPTEVPNPNEILLYMKSDLNLYIKNSSGVETLYETP